MKGRGGSKNINFAFLHMKPRPTTFRVCFKIFYVTNHLPVSKIWDMTALAASEGRVNVLEWFFATFPTFCQRNKSLVTNLYIEGAESGHIPVLDFLRRNGHHWELNAYKPYIWSESGLYKKKWKGF